MVIVPRIEFYLYKKKVECLCTRVCVNAQVVGGCAHSRQERSGKEGGSEKEHG